MQTETAPHETDESTQSSEDSDESNSDENSNKTRITGELGGLTVTTEKEGAESDECEEMFYRVWNHVLESAEEMDSSLTNRL
jgi:hypothetical protein